MTADQGSERDDAPTPLTPGELIIRRLKDGRSRLGNISTYHLADRLAALTDGSVKLTANVLQNLESGRRQQAVTLEELLLLSVALGVPPEFFLAPPAGRPIQVTPSVVAEPDEFLAWVQGRAPVPGTDADHFARVSEEVLGAGGTSADAALKAGFLRDASAILDGFLADSDQIARKTRGQVRELLNELRSAVADGASRDELLTKIDGHLSRLPTE